MHTSWLTAEQYATLSSQVQGAFIAPLPAFDSLLVQGLKEQARDALFQSNGSYTELEQGVNALVEVNLGFVQENRGSLLGSVNMVTTFATLSIGALLLYQAEQMRNPGVIFC